MKVCVVCGEKKDIMEFYSLQDKDDTFHSVCGTCRQEGHKEPDHIND